MDYLDQLEAESIYILRETAAQFARPGLLFSGGKDSVCLAYLSLKAFGQVSAFYPLVHIDTGHNFEETIQFRDTFASKMGARLIVRLVQDSINRGSAKEETGTNPSRNAIQTVTLLETIQEFQFDAVIGGARRDEEKARAKERVFSVRSENGKWDPTRQRPELWNLYNGVLKNADTMRVFPLSNWTELDVWSYIVREGIELPNIYFSHKRNCIRKDSGGLVAVCPYIECGPKDRVETLDVRCRTVGDMTCTGLIESKASNSSEVLNEIMTIRTSERSLRNDDRRSETAMEDRKKQGYF